MRIIPAVVVTEEFHTQAKATRILLPLEETYWAGQGIARSFSLHLRLFLPNFCLFPFHKLVGGTGIHGRVVLEVFCIKANEECLVM
jgi:hypothetical protein